MPTYTKETALYDTGAIKNGIDGAANTAKSYITNVSNDGVFVHEYSSSDVQPTTTGANGVHISDDVDIIRNGEVVASYGEAAVIGKETGESRVLIDYHSLQLVDKDDRPTFVVQDLRDADGEAQIHQRFEVDYIRSQFFLDFDSPDGSDFTATVFDADGADVTGNYSVSKTFGLISTSPYLAAGYALEVDYITTSENAKAFTFGRRLGETGGKSSVLGSGEASGAYSFSAGDINYATGDMSIAMGERSRATGRNSIAIGHGVKSKNQDGVVIGRYNNNQTGTAFEIGNGTSDSAPSNAFTVDWNGNVEVQGTISDGGGQLGERILTDNAAASRATGRYFNVASVTLTKGMWIVTCACSFADGTNATGIRRSYITTDAPSGWNNTTTGPASTAIVFYDQVSPLSGNYNSYTRGMGTASITTDTPVTYYLVAYHTAGSAISVTGRINAIRVGTDV